MSEADVKMQIDRYVKEFFAVRGLEEADVYFINRPHELCFRLEDNPLARVDGLLQVALLPWAPPNAGDLSQFGKISMRAPTVMDPSSVFAGSKKDNKQETLSRQNSSSDMLHVFSQNPELAPETKPSRPSSLKPRVNLAHAGVLEPAVQRRKLQLLPPSVIAAEENATILSKEEPESTPTVLSEADAKKKVDEDVKEFFAVRNLNEADDYFLKLPHEHRFRLVDKLVAFALESREADARLVGDFFAQATSNGQCTLEVFEGGFMPTVEFLDDIAINAPKAFDYMAIMLKGAGFQNDPERFQRIASKLEDSDKLISLVA
ncbi:hypothetical protein EDB19DRAFT_1921208 [Suillus lakei]|nr:hypothetical protein EDB19DRAFT_1921208 [Suillus lakei]